MGERVVSGVVRPLRWELLNCFDTRIMGPSAPWWGQMLALQPDVTEVSEQQLRQLLELQRALLDVVAGRQELSERLEHICRLFEEAVPGLVASVMRLQAQPNLVFASAPSIPSEVLEDLDGVEPGPGAGSCAAAAWSGNPVFVGDALSDPHWASVRDVALRHGIRSCWSSPVRDRAEHVIGTFALTSFQTRLPNAFQQQLMNLGATVVGLLFDQERELAQRRVAKAELARLALVANKTPNGVIYVDPEGRIEWVNDALRKLSGLDDGALIGRRLDEVMLGPLTETDTLGHLLKAIRVGEDAAANLNVYRSDGHRYAVQLTSTPRLDEDGRCIGAVVMEVDVTALNRLSDFNALLAAVSDVIATEDDPDTLLQSVCELAVKHAGLRLAWIGAPGEDGWFQFRAAAGPGIGYLDGLRISGDASSPLGIGPSACTWREERSYYNRAFGLMTSLKPWMERASKYGFAASATLPIRRGGAMWAVFTVYHGQLGSFDPALQAQLETLATNVSRGLDRIDLMRRERDIQSLNQTMLDSATVGVLLTCGNHILRSNQQAAHILGATDAEALQGVAMDVIFPASDAASVPEQVKAQFEQQGRAVLMSPAQRLDGAEVWLRIDGAPFPHEGYDQIWTLIDITQQHHAVEGQELLANALASVQEGVVVADHQGLTVYVNRAFERLTGYRRDEVQGRSCSLLQGPDTDPATVEAMRECLRDECVFEGEILNYRKSGEPFWNQLSINPLRDGTGQLTHYVGVQRDVTELRMLNERLEHQAFHDELTDLPNRRGLERYLAQALPEARRRGSGVALGMMDLDDFKVINDNYGHAFGDSLLMQVKARVLGQLAEHDDVLVRVGGDEFVVVFTGLPTGDAMAFELEHRIAALGKVFQVPFELDDMNHVEIGVSMGLARYPSDAEDEGLLLRLADEALFQAKQSKESRLRWWTMHGERPDLERVAERALDPYGAEADRLLERSETHLERVLRDFIERFYTRMDDDDHAHQILQHLDETEIEELKRRQSHHMRTLLSAGATRDSIISSSRQIGRVHALTGVDSVLLVRWIATYRDMIGTYFNAQPISARHRYRLVRLIEQRLQDDVQAQLEEQAGTLAPFMHMVTQSPPEFGSNWNEVLQAELENVSALPGVVCALALRQDSQERFSIEASAGMLADTVLSLLRGRQGGDGTSALAPPARSILMRAWQTGAIEMMPSLRTVDPALAATELTEQWLAMGMRSTVYIPVLDEQGLSVALIMLLGSFPNQFGSSSMRQFSRALHARWTDVWQRSARPPMPVSQETAIAYRERLFGGGLRMYMQPIVNLHDGRLIKLEALARLQLQDGSVLGPAVFLPLLRQADLDNLFRLGLDAALANIKSLEAHGLRVGVSLNIEPRTLTEPECAQWVTDALQRHDVEPSRLTLEILESQRLEPQALDQSVWRLVKLGIGLAMDDLGSGHSSLRRLARLPFSAIKVDQDLLTRIRVDPLPTISLIRAVIQMGGDFGCDVIVEGLEDDDRLEVARLLGAQMGQGFGIAHPMPIEDVLEWSRSYRSPGMTVRFSTPLGALAFQWLSLRQGSMHTPMQGDCPMTDFLRGSSCGDEVAVAAHQRVHEHADDMLAGQRLLSALEAHARAGDCKPH